MAGVAEITSFSKALVLGEIHEEINDGARMHSIARLAYKRGAYGYALFED